MISKLKRLLPAWLKRPMRQAVKAVRYRWRHRALKSAIGRGEPMKIIVGAAETWQAGWYSTNEQWLDITRPEHWARLFGGARLLTHVACEHVFEHLTHEEAGRALGLIASHLQPGGRIRIAVPDGHHPDPEYLRHVGIGGIGADAADHKQLLNCDVLSALLADAGFESKLVEGYRKDGSLVVEPWDAREGFIRRSRQNDAPDSRQVWGFVDADTSLIVDGTLP